MNLLIRWFLRRDMPEVLDIEQRAFDWSWTEEDFLCCLRQRNCIGMVTVADDRIVGYMLYELLKSELHILNFAVDPVFHRRGIGAVMVEKLVKKITQQRRSAISVEVRERNLAAQLFFQRQGFFATNVIRGHYEDTDEDAYAMRYVLAETADQPMQEATR